MRLFSSLLIGAAAASSAALPWPPAGQEPIAALPCDPALAAVPVLPHLESEKVCAVTDFGAKGDNSTEDTTAVQNAVDSCTTVVFPSPGKFLIRPIELRHSGLTIFIEQGATVVMWGDMDTYNQTTGKFSGILFTNESMLLQDFAINGTGTIDGQGWRWWPYGKTRPRPHILEAQAVQRVTLGPVLLKDSPSFHIMLRGDRISAVGTRVEANIESCGGYGAAPNTDGFNVGGTNIFLSDIFVHNGDDCVPLGDADVLPSSAHWRDTRNVIARNVHCECGTNSVVVILGAGNTSIRDAVFTNITAIGLNQGAGMKISEPYRTCGGVASNITWDGVHVSRPRNTALYINVFEEDAAPSQCKLPSNPSRPNWMRAQDFTFRNVVATDMGNAYAGCFMCTPDEPCTDIAFDNVTIGTTHPYKCANTHVTSTGSSPQPCG